MTWLRNSTRIAAQRPIWDAPLPAAKPALLAKCAARARKGPLLGVAALVAFGGLAASGCAENDSIVYLVGVLATEFTDCVAKPDAGAVLHSEGALDLSLARSYSGALLVASQLTQRGSREQLRTETARLRLEGAEVTLSDAFDRPLAVSPNPFSTPATGLVNPASGTTPGFAAMFADFIPASVSTQVSNAVGGDGQVIAKIRVFGTTLGGQYVESGSYTYPIRICHGCLISYPSDANGAAAGTPYTCTGMAQTSDTPVCILGQDDVAPCTQCANGNEVCKDPCQNCAVRANPANGPSCTGVTVTASCTQ